MFEDKSSEAHEDYKKLYDALKKSLERDYSDQILSNLEEARQKKRKRRDVPRTPSGSPPPQPPPSHPPTSASGAPGTSGASGSSQLPPPPPPPSNGTSGSAQQQCSKASSSSKSAASTPQSMAWTTSDTRYESAGLSGTQELSPTDSLILDDSIPDEKIHLSDDVDSGNDHLPTVDSRKDWWKPLPVEERPATPKPTWTIPSSTVSDVENNWATVLVLAFETLAENSLLAKTEDMTNFLNWYCQQVNMTMLTPADLEGKGSSPALSISKIKAASYPDFGLELLVPEQMWIEDVCTYDISAKYDISHWWFNRQKFYIDRHDSPSRRKEVKSHMRILSVVRIKAYLRYGDFEDLNLLLLQGHLDHLPGSDKQMLSTTVKLWTRNLVIRKQSQGVQAQATQSGYEYVILDSKGRDKEQRVRNSY
nr:hypothetical protein [Tanacetum cinerariifolium]